MTTGLVLGDAKTLREDTERALELFRPDAVAATVAWFRDQMAD